MDVRRIEALKDGTSVIGNRTKVKVVKNKMAPPFREAQFDILYNEGISKLGDLIDVAVEHNIIVKSGSWFSYKEERIGQGRDSVKSYLAASPKIYESVLLEVRKKLGIIPDDAPPAKQPDAKLPEAKPAAAPAKAEATKKPAK